MATGGSGTGDVFDVRRVRRLVELMNEYELGEIDLKQGEQRIRLRRESEQIVTVGSAPAAPQMVAPTAAPVAADSSGGATEASSGKFVTSPMVGTFYSSSSPDSPAFVKVGDQIGNDTVVCIIEAMKVFNEIPAECSGKIAAVLVENGDPVEFGQKLFEVT